MKHIDSHVHIYPENLMNAIYRYFERLGWKLPFRGGVEDIVKHLKECGVERAFLLLYAHKAEMSLELNRWAHELCQENPFLVPFGCFYAEDKNPGDIVRACLKDWDFAGFKLHFNVQTHHPDDDRFFPVYRGVVETGKGIVMHIGTFPNPGPHVGAARLRAVLARFPELKVMVAHLGLYEQEDIWRIMDRYHAVYLDTAFILGNPMIPGGDKLVAETLARFPDRVVYGSDFPLICHRLQDGLNFIQKLGWDEKTKSRLLIENAENFLKKQ